VIAVIRWIERWATTGSVAALPGTGHSRSPLEAHRQWLLDLVAAEPDLTLEEIRSRLKSEKRMKTGTTSVWRFYERHDITKKTLHAAEQDRPDVAAARAELEATAAYCAVHFDRPLYRQPSGCDRSGIAVSRAEPLVC
jgi:transposase